jgi:RimJ/RimL family protein N-acetyltransferase
VEPLDPARHGDELFAGYAEAADGRDWTYLPYGPFSDPAAYRSWLHDVAGGADPRFYAVIDEAGEASGVASYLRIAPEAGSIEVGHINFAPRLQRTRAATEAMYLMMRHVFDLGYRRYEWKCDALNEPSRRAAVRLGFTFEGVFRHHLVYKGRNRDTAWYAVVDTDWPAVCGRLERWLHPANFDAAANQRARLNPPSEG